MNDQATEDTPDVKKEVGLLTDDRGKRSTMRLMCIIALAASIWFAWMTLTVTGGAATSNEGVYITTAFLLAAFAPKALQKFIENSYPQAG